jgi:hypothetical protein
MVESTKHSPSFDTPVALNGPPSGRIPPKREVPGLARRSTMICCRKHEDLGFYRHARVK